MESINEVWEEICAYCKTKISEASFNAWISALTFQKIEGKEAVLFIKTNFQKQIILENFKGVLEDAFEEVLKFPVNITIKTEADIEKEPLKSLNNSAQYDYTFDTFIVGASNRFAHAASLAVADNKDVIYNPLFIWGNSGLGKTHLLSAISKKIKENFPYKKIVYETCENFTNEVIKSIHNGTTEKLREKYRTADVLLIDDIQFISGKESTEEEFFNTFNDLYNNQKQIVLTSDRPPKDIVSLSDRLVGRFEAGLIADIQPPEYETRVGIIKRKAQMMNFDLDEEITTYVADHVKCNIRQLEGVVKKLQAYSLIYDNITLSVVEGAIRDIKRDDLPQPVTIQKVVNEVSNAYNVSIEDIFSKKQNAEITHARKIAMYIIRQVTDMPYKSIGKEFGKNHATVLYSCENIANLCETDEAENKKITNIMKNLVNK